VKREEALEPMPNYQGHRGIVRYDGSTSDAWFAFVCGHCGREVSGAVVALASENGLTRWLQCPICGEGSVEDSKGVISPGAPIGPDIDGLPPEVAEAYQEARRCMSVGAFTASELVCRKILMHIAVDKGAAEGEAFASYLSHLEAQGYVTPPMRRWVDQIRSHGNESTHRLARPSRERAEGTLMFTAELLRLTYEMDQLASRYAPPPP
jgi:hypothetical protein